MFNKTKFIVNWVLTPIVGAITAITGVLMNQPITAIFGAMLLIDVHLNYQDIKIHKRLDDIEKKVEF